MAPPAATVERVAAGGVRYASHPALRVVLFVVLLRFVFLVLLVVFLRLVLALTAGEVGRERVEVGVVDLFRGERGHPRARLVLLRVADMLRDPLLGVVRV